MSGAPGRTGHRGENYLGAGRELGRLWTRKACQLVSSFPRSGWQLRASDSFLFTSFLNFLPGKSEMGSKHVSGPNG